MQILSLYYTHKPGGFCKRLYRLLNALAEAGHQVRYLSLDAPPEALSSAVSFQQIPFPLKRRSGSLFWLTFTIWAPLFFVWQAVRRKPERLVVFGAYYAFVSLPARMALKTELIVFVRSLVFRINRITEKPALLCTLSDALERIGLRAADTVVAMSSSMAGELKKFLGTDREIKILPNDVPERAPLDSTSDTALVQDLENARKQGRVVLLISGVFDRRKNLMLLLDALTTVQQGPLPHPFLLLIAGEGPELEKARAVVRDRSLEGVLFSGWVQNMSGIYQSASLVVHPALHEGMPNSVLEAWSYNIPTLVARTPELQEMAPASELWFSAEDPAQLATLLSEVARNPERLAELGRLTETCSRALRFDWDQRAVALVASC